MKLYIRKAERRDLSRICEILIFTKRMKYRSIFQNDKVSFGEMQVLSLAEEFLANETLLESYWVYDDEFVKGLIHIEENEVKELYMDSFFERKGIGRELLNFGIQEKNVDRLWVLEKNYDAIAFYEKMGFHRSGERKLEEGTPEYIIKMVR